MAIACNVGSDWILRKKKKEEGGSGKTNEIQVNSVTSLIPSC